MPSPVSSSLSPADFGKAHRKLFEDIVGPFAKSVGAKSLSDKLHLAAYGKDGDVGLVFDNIKEIEEVAQRSLPLAEAYATDQALATSAAAQAAKATGGVLTPESARFLPQEYRADYERITGCKIDAKAGTAVAGVSIKKSGADVLDVNIDFAKALSGATAKNVVLALTDHVMIVASRVDPPARSDIPPYWLVLSPREGKVPSDTWILRGNGMSGFTSPDTGSLIRAGTESIKLTDYNRKKNYLTLNVTLDAVNDIGDRVKAPSAGTKPLREAWDKRFSKRDGVFDLEKGIKDGSLSELKVADLRTMPGAKVLLSALRDNSGWSITKLEKEGLLTVVRDPATNSVAVLRSMYQEGGQYLSIIDESKKRWVGTWGVGDDGTKGWSER